MRTILLIFYKYEVTRGSDFGSSSLSFATNLWNDKYSIKISMR